MGAVSPFRRNGCIAACAASLVLSPEAALAADAAGRAVITPSAAVAVGAVSLSIALAVWAVRVGANARDVARRWASKLSALEARLEKSDAVISAHPGLVLVWEEDEAASAAGWGKPRVLGGPAALASLLSFVDRAPSEVNDPIERLLNALGDLPVEEPDGAPAASLKDKIEILRRHGAPFSATVITSEGRAIEADGRAAGAQACLWLVDPSARHADETGYVGRMRERAADLHGALGLLERAPFPAWRRGADLKLQWVNPAYAAAVEAASPQDAVARQLELDPSIRALAEDAKTEQTGVNAERYAVVGGERRTFRVIETPLRGGADAALAGAAIDVTEGDAAKTALKQQAAAYNETLNHLASAVAIFGPGAELIYYNNAFAALWELPEAELDAKPTHGEILDRLRERGALPEQADYAAWKASQLALYTDGIDADAEPNELWSLPDGRTLLLARQRHPFGGVLTVFEDITDELQLKTRYNTLIGVQRATLNNLAEGVAVFGSDGQLQLYNAAFQELWGLPQDLIAARPHFEKLIAAIDPQVRDGGAHWSRISERITSLTDDHRTPLAGCEVERRDGKTYLYATEPLPDGATLLAFLDVTDSKMREKALEERNEALQAADEMKSAFVSHVSYQLRTPLNTIIGFSELLESEMFGALNERQREYASGVLTASHQLLDLINDIIDLATIEAGRMSLDLGDVDLKDTLQSAVKLAALKAEDTQVGLRLACPDDIGVIRADERRLKQVLFNLLSNAFAFTAPGGEVELGAERAGPEVRIWVSDTGCGIQARDQARAFDRFEGRGAGSGAGLGLSLVRSFVELHGGWVALKSSPNKGTTVICHLPETAACAAAPELGLSGAAPAARALNAPAAE